MKGQLFIFLALTSIVVIMARRKPPSVKLQWEEFVFRGFDCLRDKIPCDRSLSDIKGNDKIL